MRVETHGLSNQPSVVSKEALMHFPAWHFCLFSSQSRHTEALTKPSVPAGGAAECFLTEAANTG